MTTLLWAIVLIVIGFVLLVKGADFFVEGASAVAKKLHVPTLVIGMTVVAMGTSLPELSVSISSSMANANTLAVSNVIGSNMFNLMVVLGISALFNPLFVNDQVTKKDYPFATFCAVLLLGCGAIGMELGRVDGVIFIAIFIVFLIYQVRGAMKARAAGQEVEVEGEEDIHDMPMWKAILFIVGGAVAVKFGGDWVVDGAVSFAEFCGVSDTLIGLTIVACGTSLPELATSISAARKNELDMAIGNVVGSNVFNILLILGVASAISPITFIMDNIIDICVLLAFSVLTWIFCIVKKKIGRTEGIIMLVCYAVYLVYICMR